VIARWVLHLELHPGRWPRVSLRRGPRSGDIVWNGDVLSVLERCEQCGDGFLARKVDGPLDRQRRPMLRMVRS
jgi:hypothetical protein